MEVGKPPFKAAGAPEDEDVKGIVEGWVGHRRRAEIVSVAKGDDRHAFVAFSGDFHLLVEGPGHAVDIIERVGEMGHPHLSGGGCCLPCPRKPVGDFGMVDEIEPALIEL
jgi:hypothetical protein